VVSLTDITDADAAGTIEKDAERTGTSTDNRVSDDESACSKAANVMPRP
jgi:hypothetical protein